MPFVEYDEEHAICSDCGRHFPSDEALDAHRRDAHVPAGDPGEPAPARRPAVCAVCGARFPSVAALTAHNRETHTR